VVIVDDGAMHTRNRKQCMFRAQCAFSVAEASNAIAARLDGCS
jgi:hypothetical protein